MTATDQNPQPSPRNTINFVGAAIVKDGKVLCAQRGEGRSLAGFWEFPGGKIEPHETARQALHREIEEELLCEVEVANEVCTSSYDYDFGTVVLTSFVCHLISGAPHLTEHHEIRWVAPAEMPTLDWAPADREAVRLISAMDFLAFPAAQHERHDRRCAIWTTMTIPPLLRRCYPVSSTKRTMSTHSTSRR